MKIHHPDGSPTERASLILTKSDGTTQELQGMRLAEPIETALELTRIEVHAPEELNVWTPMVFDYPASEVVSHWTPLVPEPSHWWHECHGVDVGAPDRGQGIRIGVIDEGLSSSVLQELSSSHLTYVGARPWAQDRRDDTCAEDPLTHHSEWITKILGAADGLTLPRSLAPGASLMVASAANDHRSSLDVDRVANALDFLVEECCDLVMISAGDVENRDSIQPLELAMQAAAENGTLCLVAAGNLGGPPQWPAASPSCVAVTAAGRRGSAPPDTWEANEECLATNWIAPDLFLCNSSARGAGVEVVAAGVGIIVKQADGRLVAVSGTSFACPVATGVLAVKLARDANFAHVPRDEARTRYARRVLEDICMSCSGFAFGWPKI